MPKPATQRLKITGLSLAFFGLTSAVLSWVLLARLGILALLPALRERDWLPVAAAVGALVGVTRLNRVLHVFTAAVLGLWLVVCFTPLAGRLARPLKLESPPAPADAVVVLSSSIQSDGDFCDAALERFVHGLELAHAELAPRLVLPELPPPAGSFRTAGGGLAARLGIRCPIESVGPVRDTHDEALLVSRLARERGWKRILLVTAPTHSRRAALTFRKTGLEVISSPCREVRYDLENPRLPSERILAFADSIYEIVGLQIYRSRGWA
jgi:uncharacterized SAM-binding protein YcdF (DUF218 family)